MEIWQNRQKLSLRKIFQTNAKKASNALRGNCTSFCFLSWQNHLYQRSQRRQIHEGVLDQQQYDSRTIPFKRGDIVDRNGTKMATSERVYNVILDVKVMMSDKDYIEPTIEVLKDCFGIEEDKVRELMDKSPSSRYNILQKGVDYAKAKEFEKIDKDDKKYPDVKGIWLEEDYIRTILTARLPAMLSALPSMGMWAAMGSRHPIIPPQRNGWKRVWVSG